MIDLKLNFNGILYFDMSPLEIAWDHDGPLVEIYWFGNDKAYWASGTKKLVSYAKEEMDD
jgi:hypothetical protein